MWLRSLILKMLWLSPVIVIACIGVYARTYEDPFVILSTDPVQQARVLSFQDLVKESNDAIKYNAPGPQILELMDRWQRQLDVHHEGRLIPVGADDTCTEGAKGEIFRASAGLSSYLMLEGHKIADKDPLLALHYYRASLENLELFKYMDVTSVQAAVLEERRAIRLMELLKLDGKTRAETANFLRIFLEDQKSLGDLDELSEAAYNRSLDRAQLNMVSLRGQKLDIRSHSASHARSFGNGGTPELISSLRMTHYTQANFESLIRSTIEKLTG